MPPARAGSAGRAIGVLCLLMLATLGGGCIGHRLYNDELHEYRRTIALDDARGTEFDIAIVEFDDHGNFWDLEQLEEAVRLIEQRNRESERGILVSVFVHGWKNNADPSRTTGDLVEFVAERRRLAGVLASADDSKPERVIGVYFGWRGATSRVPLQKELSFWSRLRVAERVASLNMREAFFRIMAATDSRPESKCIIAEHSMGGMIVGKTLSPSLTTLLMTNGREGFRVPSDLVVLLNPALDGLSSWQLISYLKRSNTRLELVHADGTIRPAPGPAFVSITSEADLATKVAYSLGRGLSMWSEAFQSALAGDGPSARFLATHAEGHVDYLVSHRAWMENGEVVLERVPESFNDTPFWVIRVSGDISRDHGDTRNPQMGALVNKLLAMNGVFDTGVHTRLRRLPEP